MSDRLAGRRRGGVAASAAVGLAVSLAAALGLALLADLAPAGDAPSTAGGPAAAPGAATGTLHESHSVHGMKAPAREPAQKGERATIVGEVIDPACYIEAGMKSIGPGHFQCAVDCAKSGQTLAIYDRVNDRIYFLAGEYPGQNPNAPVMMYIHKKVDVTGTVYHRSGVYGIVIQKVAIHKEPPASGTSSAGRAPEKRASKSATR